jgi:hypothetical protein
MSVNKNLSKFALKLNSSGEVTDAGLVVDYASNNFITDYVTGSFASNTYVQDFSSNATNLTSGTIASGRLSGTYAISISGSADRVDGKDADAFISNTYAIATYTSNNYLQAAMAVAASNNNVTFVGKVTGPTTDTLLIKDSGGSTVKTIRGV